MADDMKELKQMIMGLTKKVDQRFDSVDQKFNSIDQKFEGIDKRFDSMDQRFEGIDKRFDSMDKRFDGMDQRFDRIDGRLNSHEELMGRIIRIVGDTNKIATETRRDLKEFKEEVDIRFDRLEHKVDLNTLDIKYTYHKVADHDLILNRVAGE